MASPEALLLSGASFPSLPGARESGNISLLYKYTARHKFGMMRFQCVKNWGYAWSLYIPLYSKGILVVYGRKTTLDYGTVMTSGQFDGDCWSCSSTTIFDPALDPLC